MTIIEKANGQFRNKANGQWSIQKQKIIWKQFQPWNFNSFVLKNYENNKKAKPAWGCGECLAHVNFDTSYLKSGSPPVREVGK